MENSKVIRSQRKLKTLDLVYIAIGTALIAVCSWISIPFTIPFTLQTFAVFLVLLLLGGERGTLSIIVYVVMGTIGLPVFAGFKGGAGVIVGNTGGYILGFIFTGMIYMIAARQEETKMRIKIASLVAGLAVCYAFGTVWFKLIYMKNTGPVGILTVLSWCVFPFIIPDLVKLSLAVFISKRVQPVIRPFSR